MSHSLHSRSGSSETLCANFSGLGVYKGGRQDKKPRILLIDDERNMGWLVRQCLGGDYDVQQLLDAENAFDHLSSIKPNLILLDLRFPRRDGMDLLKRLKDKVPELPVIVITAYATVKTAVEAMKLGAFDYLEKPFDPTELRFLVERATRCQATTTPISLASEAQPYFAGIVAVSDKMLGVIQDIRKAASTDANVLIQGETGTGKELVARAIHEVSNRKDNPFVPINCAALPEHLLESELFGYERGAFTSAWRDKPGKFALAHGGTLFLDEIGDMPIGLQAKILRVAEERVIEPLGSTRRVQVDVRLMAATNLDLREKVSQGSFRKDLYFRLSVIPIYVPPLRDRIDDIPPLAHYFLDIFSRKYGKRFAGFDPECLEFLEQYHWPGNVRELQNLVERLVVLGEGGLIGVADVRAFLSSYGFMSSCSTESRTCSGTAWPRDIQEIKKMAERKAITEALDRFNGNRTRAAEYLGISRRAIQLKIKALGISHKHTRTCGIKCASEYYESEHHEDTT